MKTNVVMQRKMGRFTVEQRTKDGMFNATSLLKQWNGEVDSKDGNSRIKKMNDFIRLDTTNQFMDTIAETDGLNTKKIVIKNRGKYGGTWMHPYLFIDFAMWINPKFKYQVIKFVHDQLIAHRHSAGDNYNVLSSAASKLPDCDYRQIAIAMQWIVFGTTGKNLRQMATQEQLRQLADIERKLAFALDMGYINTQKQLLKEMRKMYNNKNLAA